MFIDHGSVGNGRTNLNLRTRNWACYKQDLPLCKIFSLCMYLRAKEICINQFITCLSSKNSPSAACILLCMSPGNYRQLISFKFSLPKTHWSSLYSFLLQVFWVTLCVWRSGTGVWGLGFGFCVLGSWGSGFGNNIYKAK